MRRNGFILIFPLLGILASCQNPTTTLPIEEEISLESALSIMEEVKEFNDGQEALSLYEDVFMSLSTTEKGVSSTRISVYSDLHSYYALYSGEDDFQGVYIVDGVLTYVEVDQEGRRTSTDEETISSFTESLLSGIDYMRRYVVLSAYSVLSSAIDNPDPEKEVRAYSSEEDHLYLTLSSGSGLYSFSFSSLHPDSFMEEEDNGDYVDEMIISFSYSTSRQDRPEY